MDGEVAVATVSGATWQKKKATRETMLIGISGRGNPGDESAKIKAKKQTSLDVFDKKKSADVVRC